MRSNSKLYGGLRGDQSSREVTREGKREVSTYIALPTPDGSSLDLEMWMNEHGRYTVRRYNERGEGKLIAEGNIHDVP